MLGTVRGIMLSPEDKERTAFHESGHALLGMLTPGADPVRKVSVIPRGQALGVTFQSPVRVLGEVPAGQDRWGPRLPAEEIVYGDMTTGAESDLEQVTRIARQMVGPWGMSPAIGPVSVLPPPGQEAPFGQDGVAPATKQLVDEEVRRIVHDCYAEAVTTLRERRDELDRLAHTLLQRETLDENQAYAAAGISRETAPAAVARGETPGGEPAPGLPPDDPPVDAEDGLPLRVRRFSLPAPGGGDHRGVAGFADRSVAP